MGWFFNKDNNKNQQNKFNSQEQSNTNAQPFFSSKSSSHFYSKKRSCQNDPNDNQYMICKTIIKDDNGTRQEEQRIPKNNSFGSGSFSQSTSSFSQGSGIFSPFFGTKEENQNYRDSQQQKIFDKFPSFLIQPSFFDFHNSAQQNNEGKQIRSYSFGSQKSCTQDPQHNQYLICKSKINDGNEIKQTEQRIKVSEMMKNSFTGIPSFGNEFMNFGNQIDNQIHQMVKQMNSGFNSLIPFIGPIVSFANAMNPQNRSTFFSHQNLSRNQGNNNKKYSHQRTGPNYFSQNRQKDTKIYDL